MLLNRLEFLLMNNPIRAALQRHVEVPLFLRLGGPLEGARALEIGCGRGVALALALEKMGVLAIDGFDLDPRMVARAATRLRHRRHQVRVWVGDATAIPVPAGTYDAVLDFGIVHHVPDWRRAVSEVARVLKPGGRFFAEEMLAGFIDHPIARRLLEHPRADRFDAAGFEAAVEQAGLAPLAVRRLGRQMIWLAARKDEGADAGASKLPPRAPGPVC